MNRVNSGYWLAVTGLFFAGSTNAAGEPPMVSAKSGMQVSPVVSMGLTTGGDTIATYRISYLGVEYDTDVTLGGNFFIYGGARFFWPRTGLGIIAQGGAFIGGVTDDESSADLSRWPIEAIGFYEFGRLRLGLGVTRHIAPKFEEKGIGDARIDFEDAAGTVYQAEYLLGNFTMGLRHVAIDYRYRNATLDADHWGFFGSFRFL
ncbi:MAG: hypothetical protein OEV41_00945 [Gammaproteobacteria bacterium]|nr:hypothetical protein [Gammaproteobacteria bacterium]